MSEPDRSADFSPGSGDENEPDHDQETSGTDDRKHDPAADSDIWTGPDSDATPIMDDGTQPRVIPG